ncbi:MAG: YidC/Oxa1 family insertase periplasmic-domain containing protein, partial [Planctomycetes bacterium]|nr:YidC/Oxa1 family insertase periplasmic-domain containing protein [Planctomycetota bacterium]
ASPSAQPGGDAPFKFESAELVESATLGGRDDEWKLEATFSQRGAALETLHLTERKSNEQFVHRIDTDGNEPYQLLSPVNDGQRTALSFTTEEIRVEDSDHSYSLSDVVWNRDSKSVGKVVFSTPLASPDGKPLLKLVKTFEIEPNSVMIYLSLSVQNLSDHDIKVALTQNGPIGITKENLRWNMRRVFAAFRDPEGGVEFENKQRDAIKKAEKQRIRMDEAGPDAFLWTALVNKYFAVFTRPVTPDKKRAEGLLAITCVLGAPTQPKDEGDAMSRLFGRWQTIKPGDVARSDYEICATPKDAGVLETLNPLFSDPKELGYGGVRSADSTCFCAFEPLPSLMKGLLTWIHFVVRNYGVAIIILVIIIRSMLHPLTVFQQKSMYRMQEAMGRVQPKMQAIKEKWAKDKVRLNQETMKLWSEENVNPMGGMVSMVPMFIQMPILVALWTALNTDIHLRNAPFDGWWIVDLSRPDALIDFGPGGFDVPLLSMFPLIGGMFSDIPSFNLLPLFMGVSMWLQQKYMPKPGMQAKLEAAKKAKEAGEKPPPPGKGIEDQLKQQKMMANMMAVMFPLMFYYMPAGLNLYWLATNVFGIGESIVIRKQLEKEKKKGPPKGPKKPGMLSKFFKKMAAQAEELQHKADKMSK